VLSNLLLTAPNFLSFYSDHPRLTFGKALGSRVSLRHIVARFLSAAHAIQFISVFSRSLLAPLPFVCIPFFFGLLGNSLPVSHHSPRPEAEICEQDVQRKAFVDISGPLIEP
jgi:hypothetical protein